jgi:hypothetical protein
VSSMKVRCDHVHLTSIGKVCYPVIRHWQCSCMGCAVCDRHCLCWNKLAWAEGQHLATVVPDSLDSDADMWAPLVT